MGLTIRHVDANLVLVVDRKNKVTALLSIDELAQLQKLADDEGVPATQWIRAVIKRSYAKRFGGAPARPTPATLGGLIEDLTGRAHYTTGNIAERMGLSPDTVVMALRRLEKRGIVELEQTHFNKDTTYRSLAGNRDATLAAAEKKGFEVDEPLVADDE
jgi:DNA-binding transcriptional ArsR family regulator